MNDYGAPYVLIRTTVRGSRNSHWARRDDSFVALCGRVTRSTISFAQAKPLCRTCDRLAKSEEPA